jgi:hypothetical protein
LIDKERDQLIDRAIADCLSSATTHGLTPKECFVMAAVLVGTVLSRGLRVHDRCELHLQQAIAIARIAYDADREEAAARKSMH